MPELALLAGKGTLPIEFLNSARAKGKEVITFALKGITSPEVEFLSKKVIWIKPFKFNAFLFALKKEGIKEIAILGKVEHKAALNPFNLDFKALTFLLSLKNRMPETIIKGIISEIEKLGVKVIDPTPYLSHLLLPSGVVVGTPNQHLLKEIEYGMKVAKTLATLDVGQTVVVNKGTVVALEGIEGTDECIKRGAELSGKGFVVCKAARANQDMRIDVPTVGLETVKLIGKLGGKALAFEAGKTYVLDLKEMVNFAKTKKITILAL